ASTGGAGGSGRPPETTLWALPAASGVNGRVYPVTDGASTGSCSAGGGSSRTLCRSNGSAYECIGNCVIPGGSTGQIQFNNSGSFAGQAYVLSRTPYQRGVECSTGTVDYTSL